MKKKEILKTIITIIVSVVLSSGISVYATSTYLYDSCDVSYDNTSSGLNSTNVQSSLDELYMHATDYSELKNYFQNNPTSYFYGTDLEINQNGTRGGFVDFWYNGKNRAGVGVSHADGTLQVISKSESGGLGQGKLDILGKPININATNGGTGDINLSGNVKINGTSVGDLIKAKTVSVPCTSLTQNYNLSSLISLDSGYKFLAWESVGSSNGWVTGFPIYLANPISTGGGVFWNGAMPTNNNQSVIFTYFEVKS